MRYAVASLWSIPALVLLGLAGAFGALDHVGHVLWLFVADVAAMFGFGLMALVDSWAAPERERRRVIALALPGIGLSVALAILFFALTHATWEWDT